MGGTITGGVDTGGVVMGGTVTGGTDTGGIVMGGTVTGGVDTGGVVTGGLVTGGVGPEPGPVDWGPPGGVPATVPPLECVQ
jgi:hypothetical protein